MRSLRSSTRLGKTNLRKPDQGQNRWVKSVSLIFGLVILLLGLKLLLQPITAALGNLWENSTTVITSMINAPRLLKQEDGATNVLMVGVDRRSSVPYSYAGVDGTVQKNGFLADTIIIGSYNHRTQEISLISLPRDLWIRIPAFNSIGEQHSKVNAAHAYGDQLDYPGGGMALLEDVLEETLDLQIQYVIRVDFEGFEQAVDAIDGITIDVDNAFDDYLYPREGYENAPWDERFEHIHFDRGLQTMDGVTALKYARSRKALGTEGNDFARAKRQQKVIVAAKNKVLSSETLFNLDRLRKLYLSLSKHVYTNIQFNELPLFYSLADQVSEKKVKLYVLGNEEAGGNFLTVPSNVDDYGGAWVLIPNAGIDDFSEIQRFFHEIIFQSGQAPTPTVLPIETDVQTP